MHVVCGWHLRDLHGDLVTLGDLTEDRVLRRALREPVEVCVVVEVHEELAAARVRPACARAPQESEKRKAPWLSTQTTRTDHHHAVHGRAHSTGGVRAQVGGQGQSHRLVWATLLYGAVFFNH